MSMVLALSVGLSCKNNFGLIGYVLAAVLAFYTLAFDSVVPRYLPVKHYGDSD